jgi:uncharacterized membrane protein YjjB (DUF3815 family)
MRLQRLKAHRTLAWVCAVVGLIPCGLWMTTMLRFLYYDYERPEAEQPLFKSLGLMVTLKDYLPIFLLSLSVLLVSIATAFYKHGLIAGLWKQRSGHH